MSAENSLYVKNRREWRDWLAENHHRSSGVWLVYYKKDTGTPSIPYGDSVEEALCFGWIDSIIKKLDEKRYLRKFTPRKKTSRWSELNKSRAEKMIRQNRMTEVGSEKIRAAKLSGEWSQKRPRDMNPDSPEEFKNALKNNPKASDHFKNLAPSMRRQYAGWIAAAKRAETRLKRVKEAVALLEKNRKLGMK